MPTKIGKQPLRKFARAHSVAVVNFIGRGHTGNVPRLWVREEEFEDIDVQHDGLSLRDHLACDGRGYEVVGGGRLDVVVIGGDG